MVCAGLASLHEVYLITQTAEDGVEEAVKAALSESGIYAAGMEPRVRARPVLPVSAATASRSSHASHRGTHSRARNCNCKARAMLGAAEDALLLYDAGTSFDCPPARNARAHRRCLLCPLHSSTCCHLVPSGGDSHTCEYSPCAHRTRWRVRPTARAVDTLTSAV